MDGADRAWSKWGEWVRQGKPEKTPQKDLKRREKGALHVAEREGRGGRVGRGYVGGKEKALKDPSRKT